MTPLGIRISVGSWLSLPPAADVTNPTNDAIFLNSLLLLCSFSLKTSLCLIMLGFGVGFFFLSSSYPFRGSSGSTQPLFLLLPVVYAKPGFAGLSLELEWVLRNVLWDLLENLPPSAFISHFLLLLHFYSLAFSHLLHLSCSRAFIPGTRELLFWQNAAETNKIK